MKPKHPPVDPEFFAIGAASGMSDEEIQADWDAYCDDLEKFHNEIDARQAEEMQPEPESGAVLDALLNIVKDPE